MKDIIPAIKKFWPEAKGRLHIDAWRAVTNVDGMAIKIVEKNLFSSPTEVADTQHKLFFLNLGGYKEHDFEEYHYKLLTVANSLQAASKTAKQTAFYKHTSFEEAVSHIDDKYGVDIDDAFEVKDILPAIQKEQYKLLIEPCEVLQEDEIHIGYFKLEEF